MLTIILNKYIYIYILAEILGVARVDHRTKCVSLVAISLSQNFETRNCWPVWSFTCHRFRWSLLSNLSSSKYDAFLKYGPQRKRHICPPTGPRNGPQRKGHPIGVLQNGPQRKRPRYIATADRHLATRTQTQSDSLSNSSNTQTNPTRFASHSNSHTNPAQFAFIHIDNSFKL
jgi:hypothetical protein